MMHAVVERHLALGARLNVWVFATIKVPEPLRQAIVQKSALHCLLAGCQQAEVTAACKL